MNFLNLETSTLGDRCPECGSPTLIDRDDAGGDHLAMVCVACGFQAHAPVAHSYAPDAVYQEKADAVLWAGYPDGTALVTPVEIPCDLSQDSFEAPEWAYVVKRTAAGDLAAEPLVGTPPAHEECVAALVAAASRRRARNWKIGA